MQIDTLSIEIRDIKNKEKQEKELEVIERERGRGKGTKREKKKETFIHMQTKREEVPVMKKVVEKVRKIYEITLYLNKRSGIIQKVFSQSILSLLYILFILSVLPILSIFYNF